MESTNSFTKQEWDQVLYKGKHPLSSHVKKKIVMVFRVQSTHATKVYWGDIDPSRILAVSTLKMVVFTLSN